MPFMVAAILGAMANLIGLVFVSLHSDRAVMHYWECAFLFVSVGFFLCLIAALEILARIKLDSFKKELVAIQKRSS
jgi:hypothetical protein